MQKYQANDIYSHIHLIGSELLNKNFDLSAYTHTPDARYTMTCIWEGQDKGISLFIFIWPPQDASQKVRHPYWHTNIHSHPISCAFTPLKEKITQVSYDIYSDYVKKKMTENFTPGTVVIDDTSEPFAHQLMCLENAPAVTLHAYGKGTEKLVHKTFYMNKNTHSYQRVLQDDGSITFCPW